MILAEYLPQRSAADRLAERVRLQLGGQDWVLPVLSIADNETWVAGFAASAQDLLTGIALLDDAAAVLLRFAAAIDVQLHALRTYDKTDVLPDDEWLRSHASPDALLAASLEVLACAFPLAAVVLDMVARNPEMVARLVAEGMTARTVASPPTNSVPPSTAGRRAKSEAA